MKATHHATVVLFTAAVLTAFSAAETASADNLSSFVAGVAAGALLGGAVNPGLAPQQQYYYPPQPPATYYYQEPQTRYIYVTPQPDNGFAMPNLGPFGGWRGSDGGDD